MKQTNVFGSCLVRQVNEAVRIEMSTADCVMNSKSEFHQASLVRVVPVNGLVEEQGAGVEWTHSLEVEVEVEGEEEEDEDLEAETLVDAMTFFSCHLTAL